MKKVYKSNKGSLLEHTLGYFQGFGSLRNRKYDLVSQNEVNAAISSLAVDQMSSVSGEATSRLISQMRTFYTTKDALINEYDSLDPSDPVVSSCLDQYADACIILDANKIDGEPYTLQGSSEKDVSAIREIFIDQKLPSMLWQWSRHLCKYGELFIVCKYIKVKKGEVKFKVDMEVDPKRYSSVQIKDTTCILDNYLSAFVDTDIDGNDVSSKYAELMECEKIKVIHIALPSRTEACKDIDLVINSTKIMRVRDKSGSSILDPVLIITRIIKLIEDMLLICRMDKSQMTRIYSIEVGKSDEKKVKLMLNNFKSLIGNRQALSTISNNYSANKSTKILNEIIVPTRDGVGAVSIEDVSSEFKVGDLGDLSYFQNKFYAGIKIPKVYLGYEEEAPSGFGEDPLTKIDARFAKAVRRISGSLEDGLNRVIKCYFSMINNKSAEAPSVILTLNRDRTKDELEVATNNENIARSVESVINTLRLDTRLDSDKVVEAVFKEMLPGISSIVYNRTGGVKKKFESEEPEEPPVTNTSEDDENLIDSKEGNNKEEDKETT